jgi:hypothetical protein
MESRGAWCENLGLQGSAMRGFVENEKFFGHGELLVEKYSVDSRGRHEVLKGLLTLKHVARTRFV